MTLPSHLVHWPVFPCHAKSATFNSSFFPSFITFADCPTVLSSLSSFNTACPLRRVQCRQMTISNIKKWEPELWADTLKVQAHTLRRAQCMIFVESRTGSQSFGGWWVFSVLVWAYDLMSTSFSLYFMHVWNQVLIREGVSLPRFPFSSVDTHSDYRGFGLPQFELVSIYITKTELWTFTWLLKVVWSLYILSYSLQEQGRMPLRVRQ